MYQRCDACGGRGALKCHACKCGRCDGTGKMQRECEQCNEPRVVGYARCASTGRLLKKGFFFGDTYETCFDCNGSRQRKCAACKGEGNTVAQCAPCGGTGASRSCAECTGTGELSCVPCSGYGRFRANWSKDKIRAEIESRKDQISELKEAIQFHLEAYERMPQDGFQGRDLETRVYELRQEIDTLRSWL